MNAWPLFMAALLPLSIIGFVMSASLQCGHDLGIGCAPSIEGESTGGRRLRGVGRQDVYLQCINTEVCGDWHWSVMACATWVCGCLHVLLLRDKHSMRERFIIH